MPQIDAEQRAERWTNYDHQTVVIDEDTDRAKVDHGASARANLKQLGKDVLDAFDPTNHFRDTIRNCSSDHWLGVLAGSFWTALMVPWNFIGEVFDPVAMPLRLVKDASDVVTHSVAAGIARIKSDD